MFNDHYEGDHNGSNPMGRLLLNSVAQMPSVDDQINKAIEAAQERMEELSNSISRYDECIRLLTEDLCNNDGPSHGKVHKLIGKIGGLAANSRANYTEHEHWISEAKNHLEEIHKDDGRAQPPSLHEQAWSGDFQ